MKETCTLETTENVPVFRFSLSAERKQKHTSLISRSDYPASWYPGVFGRLSTHSSPTNPDFGHKKKRVMGIEPTYPAWKAGVLPLNYTRVISDTSDILPQRQKECKLFLYFYSTFLLLLVKHRPSEYDR